MGTTCTKTAGIQLSDTLKERAWEPKSFVTSLLADKIEAEGSTPFESRD